MAAPTVQHVPIGSIKPNPSNPRTIRDERFYKLVQSIKDFPEMLELRPIVTDADRVVLGGNMRLKACKAAGLKTVPVVVADHLTESQRREFIVKDNVGFGDWDWDALANEWDAGELEAWGLEVPDSAQEPAAGLTDPDAVPEVPDEPITKSGDLWLLGRHRLLCGDSTNQDDITRLLNGETADMVFTDPPYVLFGNSTGVNGIADDKMVRPFFRDILAACRQHTKMYGHVYVCCDWHSAFTIEAMSREVELAAKNLIVWDKGGGGVGAMYQQTHELIWFFANSPKQKTTTRTEKAGERVVHGISNIWRFPRVRASERNHNAAKPVDMLAVPLEASSDHGEIVLDLFLGSGTTLIAAQQLNRRCYGMEIDPKYCDVIVRRWEEFTGQKATRQNREDSGNADTATAAA